MGSLSCDWGSAKAQRHIRESFPAAESWRSRARSVVAKPKPNPETGAAMLPKEQLEPGAVGYELQDSEVAQLHSKFNQDPTLGVRIGTYAGIGTFDAGVTQVVGSMDALPLRAMYAEHCLSSDSKQKFKAPNSSSETTPQAEWCFVVGEDGVDMAKWELNLDSRIDETVVSMAGDRNAKSIKELLALEKSKRAELQPPEIVALRLYTGPLYSKYNHVLRKEGKVEGNRYPTTINLIVSGVVKLSRVSEPPSNLTVWRGFGGTALPHAFFEPDAQGFAGGTELGFMSTSLDKQVAVTYSGKHRNRKVPTLFRFQLSKTSMGADVSYLSQFESECEFLYPPFTHLMVRGAPVLMDGISIVPIKLTVNQRFRTLQQTINLRRTGMLETVSSLVWDLRHWASKSQAEGLGGRIDGLHKMLNKLVNEFDGSWYNTNYKYQQQFSSILQEFEQWDLEIREGRGKELLQSGQSTDVSEEKGEEDSAGLEEHLSDGSTELMEYPALVPKFNQVHNFVDCTGIDAGIAVFDFGIERLVGNSDVQPIRAMYAEHCLSEESNVPFSPPECNGITTPSAEWFCVAGANSLDDVTWTLREDSTPQPSALEFPGRSRNCRRISDLMDHADVKAAGLSVAEVLALRLSTGPMGAVYNMVLHKRSAPTMYTGKDKTLFGTTINLIVSALVKLSRTTIPPEGRVAYRGLEGDELPTMYLPCPQGFIGGVEGGLIFLSRDRTIAARSSSKDQEHGLPVVFRYEMDKTSVAADVSAVSQFDGEAEAMLPPVTHLEILRHGEEDGAYIIDVKPTINQHFRTVEQSIALRKMELKGLAFSLVQDVKHWMAAREAPWLQDRADKILERLYAKLDEFSVEQYNENAIYRRMFNELMDISEQSRKDLVESQWDEGKLLRGKGSMGPASYRWGGAIFTLQELCADSEENRARVLDMKNELIEFLKEIGPQEDGYDKSQITSWTYEMANSLMNAGRWKEAKVMLSRVLWMRKMELGDKHLDVAHAYESIGSCNWNLGEYQEAMDNHEKALELKQELAGERSEQTAHSMAQIAQILEATGDPTTAIQYLEVAIDIMLEKKQRNLTLAAMIGNLGNCHSSQGDFEKALQYQRNSLKISRVEAGNQSADVAGCLNEIGFCLEGLQRYPEALEAYEESKNIKVKVLGENHPDSAHAWAGLATVHFRQGETEKALELMTKCVNIFREAYQGTPHLSVAQALGNLAAIYEHMEQWDKAAPLLLEAYEIKEQCLGAEDEQTEEAKESWLQAKEQAEASV